MDLDALRAEARRLADDTAASPLYSDTAFRDLANEAEREACSRGRLLYDDSSDFCTVGVLAATATYAIDPLITVIDRALYAPTTGRARALDLVGIDALERADDDLSQTGKPTKLVHASAHLVRLWPKPNPEAAGELRMAVYRLPLFDMEDGDDEPEIAPELHNDLIHWMLYKAFLTKDGEQGDLALAEMHLDLFEARFGKKPSADALRRQRERRRVTTSYGGIR